MFLKWNTNSIQLLEPNRNNRKPTSKVKTEPTEKNLNRGTLTYKEQQSRHTLWRHLWCHLLQYTRTEKRIELRFLTFSVTAFSFWRVCTQCGVSCKFGNIFHGFVGQQRHEIWPFKERDHFRFEVSKAWLVIGQVIFAFNIHGEDVVKTISIMSNPVIWLWKRKFNRPYYYTVELVFRSMVHTDWSLRGLEKSVLPSCRRCQKATCFFPDW